jgi:rhomboid protease GluP
VTDSALPPQREIESGPRSFSRPTFRTQLARFPVTFILIGLTILTYLGQEISTYIFGFDIVISYGAKINEAIYAGEWWRFITPIFIHVDILHIFVNMYSLNAIGPTVEGFFGRPRMLIVFISSGIVGVIFSLTFTPNPSVGA